MRGALPMLTLAVIALMAVAAPVRAGMSVVDTPHNLSATGPGAIHALSEDRVCIFCHTPHRSRTVAPLWNRRDSTETYLPYTSTTLDSEPGQPTGSSKLCLSCHDGTIALGELVSEFTVIPMTGTSGALPEGHGLIGTDLRDDHPISFVPVLENPELAPPSSWGSEMQLDINGEFQCTTCHDPHDNTFGEFLVMDNTEGSMCLVCHTLTGWVAASHAQVRTLTANLELHVGPIPGGCGVCHVPHGAGFVPLLRGGGAAAADDAGCLECHGGSDLLAPNIRASMIQASGHFVDRYRGQHRADESPEEAATHVSCLDCHNPHRSTSRPAAGPMDIGGALEGVPGMTYTGIELDEAQFEYEVCLRCHGGRQAEAQGFPVRRQLEQFDLAREIDPSNASHHPIVAPGRNPNVPSLLTQWSEGSVMRCTSCHSGEKETSAGPHGSPHEWILAGEYQTGDGITESPRAYQLCYQCHSRPSILANESFPEHRLHVLDDRTSCAVCHDPHGVSHTQGDPINHSHLINFDISVVEPEPMTGRLEFVDMGAEAGACYLTCHGHVHGPEVY